MNLLEEAHLLPPPDGEETPQAPPQARKLSELIRPERGEDPTELLKNRYLCRGGGLLLCGQTGVGKSSFTIQCAIQWALDRPCLEIEPTRPLKSLIIQAENDDGDLAEMRDGVIRGLNLNEADAKKACENIIIAREDSRTGVNFFLQVVKPLLDQHRPDLLWIDPALSYMGGETSSQKDVGAFLRNRLNPLIREFNCGAVVVHHTNKPPSGAQKSEWAAGEYAYLGSGSAEWANWSRAVLVIRSIGSHLYFELRAAKRGARLGWKEADGETTAYTKMIGHHREPGLICWEELEEGDAPVAKPQRAYSNLDLLPHVPPDKVVPKNVLLQKAMAAGIGEKRARAYLDELINEKRLHYHYRPRPRTNPEVLVARFPQPTDPEPELPGTITQ